MILFEAKVVDETAITATESASDKEEANEETVGNKPADKPLNIDRRVQ